MELANKYNLDTDLVFQTQWRKSDCSFEAINEHLSKVTKQFRVLNECITKVPDSVEATKSLLNFGLEKAQLENLDNPNESEFLDFTSTKEDEFHDSTEESVEMLYLFPLLLEKINNFFSLYSKL